jgi:excisionase family DNA binding protein
MSVEQLLTLLELADQLKISPHTIRKFVRDGRLKPTRICRRLLFSPSEVRRFLETCLQENARRSSVRRSAA